MDVSGAGGLTTALRGDRNRTMEIGLPRSRATATLLGGFAAFLVAIVYIIGSSLTKRTAPVFAPTPFGAPRSPARPAVDTLTADARGERAWTFVDLERGIVFSSANTSAWDLAVRRHNIGASGAIADAGRVSFDAVTGAPAGSFVASSMGRDTVNAAISRWYVYGMMSHLLEPNGHVYVVRTRAGRDFKLEILSYYCPGLEAGCLTFRYAALPSP